MLVKHWAGTLNGSAFGTPADTLAPVRKRLPAPTSDAGWAFMGDNSDGLGAAVAEEFSCTGVKTRLQVEEGSLVRPGTTSGPKKRTTLNKDASFKHLLPRGIRLDKSWNGITIDKLVGKGRRACAEFDSNEPRLCTSATPSNTVCFRRPLHPDMFDQLISTKHFTQAADSKLVAKLYLQVVTRVLAGAQRRLDLHEKVSERVHIKQPHFAATIASLTVNVLRSYLLT